MFGVVGFLSRFPSILLLVSVITRSRSATRREFVFSRGAFLGGSAFAITGLARAVGGNYESAMARARSDDDVSAAVVAADHGSVAASASAPALVASPSYPSSSSVAAASTAAAVLANTHDTIHRGLVAASNSDALVHAYMSIAPAANHTEPGDAPAAAAASPALVTTPPPSSTDNNTNAAFSAVAHLLPTRCPPFRESYSDMSELRRELKVLSVRMGLPYYMQHSSPQRLEARCPTWKHRKTAPTTCEFVVSANRHTNGRVFVTRAVVAHGAGCAVAHANPGSYISAAALMETAKPFMAQAGESVRPKDMASIMKDQFGVSTSYMTAWRALSAFRQQKKGEESASYTKIKGYLDAFVTSNAGSAAAFECLPETTTFARAFLCPKPLQLALRYCRSSVLLSVFLITSAFGGVLMTATTQDAMGENVPIAVGVAPVESDENWRFFLTHLRKAVPDAGRPLLTFVHSRGEELQRPLHELFPDCHQSDAVEVFATVSASGSGAASVDHPFQWLEALSAKTPLMILVGWVSKVASTLFQRFEKYGQVQSEYPEEFHARLMQYEADASHFEVLRIAENGYEVIDHQTGRQRIVDFGKQSCTCGEYDVSRFPCLHVFLTIAFTGMMRTDVIPPMYLMSSLKALYGGRITPIDVETVESDGVTAPIPQPKSRGRPRKVQQIQQFGDVKQEKLACSVCGVKGHNKRTCKRALADGASNAGATSHELATSLHASGSVGEEDVEPTFLDSTCTSLSRYVCCWLALVVCRLTGGRCWSCCGVYCADEEDLPFDHSALHHSSEHQLAMEEAAAAAIHAVATKHVHAGDELDRSSSSGGGGSASSPAKRRRLSASGASTAGGAALDDGKEAVLLPDEKTEHHQHQHHHHHHHHEPIEEPTMALL